MISKFSAKVIKIVEARGNWRTETGKREKGKPRSGENMVVTT